MALHPDIEKELRRAIKHFWSTRQRQAKKQGSKSGARDAGSRTAVTGGRQMDGFINLVRDYLCSNGLPKAQVFCGKAVEIPGWYRPEKQWDLLVISDGELIAGIEFKSQVGSFGNNYNNRTEEAIGSATDIWAAFREGAFKPSARPWLGYMMLLEDAPASTRPVKAREPHFKVFPEFVDVSYRNATKYSSRNWFGNDYMIQPASCFPMPRAARRVIIASRLPNSPSRSSSHLCWHVPQP